MRQLKMMMVKVVKKGGGIGDLIKNFLILKKFFKMDDKTYKIIKEDEQNTFILEIETNKYNNVKLYNNALIYKKFLSNKITIIDEIKNITDVVIFDSDNNMYIITKDKIVSIKNNSCFECYKVTYHYRDKFINTEQLKNVDLSKNKSLSDCINNITKLIKTENCLQNNIILDTQNKTIKIMKNNKLIEIKNNEYFIINDKIYKYMNYLNDIYIIEIQNNDYVANSISKKTIDDLKDMLLKNKYDINTYILKENIENIVIKNDKAMYIIKSDKLVVIKNDECFYIGESSNLKYKDKIIYEVGKVMEVQLTFTYILQNINNIIKKDCPSNK